MMKALTINNPGQNATTNIVQRPVPKPKSNEILIKVAASGLNRADIFQKKGLYPPPKGVTDIPGLEVSGTVNGLGKNVTGYKHGDKICALLPGGGHAEYAVAHKHCVLPAPKNLPLIHAAALPETCFTVWNNLFNIAKLKHNETLLIHGGSSGIGSTAVKLAKLFEINTFVTTSSEKKCQLVNTWGATHVINYIKQDFENEISTLTKNKGVNVILDIIGGDYIQKNLNCLAQNGRLICLSFLKGARTNLNLTPMLVKNLTITGTTLRNKSPQQKKEIRDVLEKKLWQHIENKKFTPVIDTVYTFKNIEKAFEKMEEKAHIGKILLQYQ